MHTSIWQIRVQDDLRVLREKEAKIICVETSRLRRGERTVLDSHSSPDHPSDEDLSLHPNEKIAQWGP
jgi:hypothetical protein